MIIPTPTKYNFSADFIRALAIVFVVILHVYSEFLSSSTQFSSFSWWAAIILQTITKIAVPVFIMLSGFLILDQTKNYSLKEFYKKRLSRIGLPLLFWPLFYYSGLIIMGQKTFSFIQFTNDYIFLNTFYHLYFLYIIAGLYLAAPFLKKVLTAITRKEKKFLLFISLAFSTIVTICIYFTQSKLNYWSIFTVFVPFLGYFIAGDYLRDITLNLKQRGFALGAAVGCLILIVLAKYFAYSTSNLTITRYLDDVLSIGSILLSILGYSLLKSININKSGFYQKIAKASFGIYIIHPLILFIFNRFLSFEPNHLMIGLILLIKAMIVFAISFLIVLIARKFPLVKQLFGD